MDISTLLAEIEKTAPLDGAASWDCSGLQVASPNKDIQRLGVSLDPTPASVEKALDLGCDGILTHHPLTLSPRLPKALDAYHSVLRSLLRKDVPLYASHTSLDTNLQGPAAWLADELGLLKRKPLEPLPHDPTRGFGLCGDLPQAVSGQSFLQKLGDLVPEPTTTICGQLPEKICRVAYCTGSGASLLPLAKSAGADIYISGDIKYHAALDADIFIVDVGHHSLEEEMMHRFSQLLGKSLRIQVTFVPSQSPFRPMASQLSKQGDI
ncbi:MAG: Nif3-like dinuclear metal center hexameric protein [Desulfovibrio sp.]|nr:Nif3-like dinuclear metal center hexameric protein [Desulfovibrio sp.]